MWFSLSTSHLRLVWASHWIGTVESPHPTKLALSDVQTPEEPLADAQSCRD